MSIRRSSFTAFVAILLVATQGRAQQTAGVDAEARRHFDTGVSLYEEHNYEGALTEFRESFRLRAVPIVMFDTAQSERELLRYPEAIESYTRYLQMTGPEVPADRRAAVQNTIDTLRAALGSVQIVSDPPAAALRIDGRDAGITPRREIALAAGTHVIELTRDGFDPLRAEVTVVAQRASPLEYRLVTRAGIASLTVQAREANATVRIDGTDVGRAPVSRTLSAGGHIVEVRAAGHDPYSHEVFLAERQHRVLRVELDAHPGLATRWYLWAGVGVALTAIAIVVTYLAVAPMQSPSIPGTGDPSVIYAITSR